jgi:hypothetical protein
MRRLESEDVFCDLRQGMWFEATSNKKMELKKKKRLERVSGQKKLQLCWIGRRSAGLTWYLFNLGKEKKAPEGGDVVEGGK